MSSQTLQLHQSPLKQLLMFISGFQGSAHQATLKLEDIAGADGHGNLTASVHEHAVHAGCGLGAPFSVATQQQCSSAVNDKEAALEQVTATFLIILTCSLPCTSSQHAECEKQQASLARHDLSHVDLAPFLGWRTVF